MGVSITKEKREVIQLGIQNRNTPDIIKFSVAKMEVIWSAEPSKGQWMLSNQGTPENVRLEAEKELGVCTGQFFRPAQKGASTILLQSFLRSACSQSSSASWRF